MSASPPQYNLTGNNGMSPPSSANTFLSQPSYRSQENNNSNNDGDSGGFVYRGYQGGAATNNNNNTYQQQQPSSNPTQSFQSQQVPPQRQQQQPPLRPSDTLVPQRVNDPGLRKAFGASPSSVDYDVVNRGGNYNYGSGVNGGGYRARSQMAMSGGGVGGQEVHHNYSSSENNINHYYNTQQKASSNAVGNNNGPSEGMPYYHGRAQSAGTLEPLFGGGRNNNIGNYSPARRNHPLAPDGSPIFTNAEGGRGNGPLRPSSQSPQAHSPQRGPHLQHQYPTGIPSNERRSANNNDNYSPQQPNNGPVIISQPGASSMFSASDYRLDTVGGPSPPSSNNHSRRNTNTNIHLNSTSQPPTHVASSQNDTVNQQQGQQPSPTLTSAALENVGSTTQQQFGQFQKIDAAEDDDRTVVEHQSPLVPVSSPPTHTPPAGGQPPSASNDNVASGPPFAYHHDRTSSGSILRNVPNFNNNVSSGGNLPTASPSQIFLDQPMNENDQRPMERIFSGIQLSESIETPGTNAAINNAGGGEAFGRTNSASRSRHGSGVNFKIDDPNHQKESAHQREMTKTPVLRSSTPPGPLNPLRMSAPPPLPPSQRHGQPPQSVLPQSLRAPSIGAGSPQSVASNNNNSTQLNSLFSPHFKNNANNFASYGAGSTYSEQSSASPQGLLMMLSNPSYQPMGRAGSTSVYAAPGSGATHMYGRSDLNDTLMHLNASRGGVGVTGGAASALMEASMMSGGGISGAGGPTSEHLKRQEEEFAKAEQRRLQIVTTLERELRKKDAEILQLRLALNRHCVAAATMANYVSKYALGNAAGAGNNLLSGPQQQGTASGGTTSPRPQGALTGAATATLTLDMSENNRQRNEVSTYLDAAATSTAPKQMVIPPHVAGLPLAPIPYQKRNAGAKGGASSGEGGHGGGGGGIGNNVMCGGMWMLEIDERKNDSAVGGFFKTFFSGNKKTDKKFRKLTEQAAASSGVSVADPNASVSTIQTAGAASSVTPSGATPHHQLKSQRASSGSIWKYRFIVADEKGISVYRNPDDFQQLAYHKMIAYCPYSSFEYFIPRFSNSPGANESVQVSRVNPTTGAIAGAGSSNPDCRPLFHIDADDARGTHFGFIARQPIGTSRAKPQNPPLLFRITSSQQEYHEWSHFFAMQFNRRLYRESFPQLYVGVLDGETVFMVSEGTNTTELDLKRLIECEAEAVGAEIGGAGGGSVPRTSRTKRGVSQASKLDPPMEDSEELLNKLFTPEQQEQLKRFTTPEGLAAVELELQQKIDAAREEAAEASRVQLLTSFENYKQSLVEQCSEYCQTDFDVSLADVAPSNRQSSVFGVSALPSNSRSGSVINASLPPSIVQGCVQQQQQQDASGNSMRRDSNGTTIILPSPANTTPTITAALAPPPNNSAAANSSEVTSTQQADNTAPHLQQQPQQQTVQISQQDMFTKDRVVTLEKLVETLESQLKEKMTEVRAMRDQTTYFQQECEKEKQATAAAKTALEEIKIANKVLFAQQHNEGRKDPPSSILANNNNNKSAMKRVSIQDGGVLSPIGDSPTSSPTDHQHRRLNQTLGGKAKGTGADEELELRKDTAALIADLEDEVGELKDENTRLKGKMTRLQRDYESKVRQVCEKAAEDLKLVVTAANNTITTTSESILNAAAETEKQRKLKEKERQRRIADPNALADGSDFYAAGRYVPTAWAAFESAGGLGRTSMLSSTSSHHTPQFHSSAKEFIEPFLPTIRIAIDRCSVANKGTENYSTKRNMYYNSEGDGDMEEEDNMDVPSDQDLTFVARYNASATVLEAHHRQTPSVYEQHEDSNGHGRMTLNEGWAFRDVETRALVVLQLQCFVPTQDHSPTSLNKGSAPTSSFEKPFTVQKLPLFQHDQQRYHRQQQQQQPNESLSGVVSTPRGHQSHNPMTTHPPPFVHYPNRSRNQPSSSRPLHSLHDGGDEVEEEEHVESSHDEEYDIVGSRSYDRGGGVLYPKPVSVKNRIFNFNKKAALASRKGVHLPPHITSTSSATNSNLSSPNDVNVSYRPSLMRKEAENIDAIYNTLPFPPPAPPTSTWPLRDLPSKAARSQPVSYVSDIDVSAISSSKTTSNVIQTPRRDTGVDVLRNGPRGTKASDLRRKVGDTAAALEMEEARLEASLSGKGQQQVNNPNARHNKSPIRSTSVVSSSTTTYSRTSSYQKNGKSSPLPPPFVVTSGSSSRHLSGLLSDQQRRHLAMARKLISQQQGNKKNEVHEYEYSDSDESTALSPSDDEDENVDPHPPENTNIPKGALSNHGFKKTTHESSYSTQPQNSQPLPLPPPPQNFHAAADTSTGDGYEYPPAEYEQDDNSEFEDEDDDEVLPPPSEQPPNALTLHHYGGVPPPAIV